MRKNTVPPDSTTLTLPDTVSFKNKALYWANHFHTFCLLDSNGYSLDKYKSHEWTLAIDALEVIGFGDPGFDELRKFQRTANSDIFGFFSYDIKNKIENLESRHQDIVPFPDLYFFKPRYLLRFQNNKLTVNRNYPETYELIEHIEKVHIPKPAEHKPIRLTPRTSKAKYVATVDQIKEQIGRGDFYELNYCNEFYSLQAKIHPVETFLNLNQKAAAPFSCLFKTDDKFLLCTSPERFLKKQGSLLISQPIKGTIRKGKTSEENELLKQKLSKDKKEIAENTMVVDLVRNDLSKTAREGSVVVEELCGIYEFNTVNQMISTIKAELPDGVDFAEAIQNAFPMGSMTGAPKLEVMKNIERYEDFKRGIYSGSVGYISPNGDFDLNVVIRSILYDAQDKHISIRVGSAITADSEPEKEYQEILLKAESLIEVIDGQLK